MIRAVLFDLGETLLDRTKSLTAFIADQHRRFCDRLGTSTADVWRDRFLALDAGGHVHKSIVYSALLAEFGGDSAAAEALLADYVERCSWHASTFPGMADTLRGLRSRGIALGIVTNGETVFQSRHIAALGLHEMVDAILISQREGLRKPDPALFRRAADRLKVAPGQCLFVGDNPAIDILGAHAAGMLTAWFNFRMTWPDELPPRPGATIDELPQVLDIVEGTRSVTP